MPIPIEEPVIKPEVPKIPEKIYDTLWVKRLQVIAPSNTEGKIQIITFPCNADGSDISQDLEDRTVINGNLWELYVNVPEVATAMNAVFAAIPAIKAYQAGQ